MLVGATYTVKTHLETQIVRSGFFNGWNTTVDGTGTPYAREGALLISGNITLYAQWKISLSNSGSGGSTPALMAYVIGYGDATVRPSANITRAEVATIYFRLLTGESRNQYWATSNDYQDVSAASWYHNAVSTMSNAGILSGYTDGSFGGNRNITRAEFAVIAARFDSGVYTGENQFGDISGHWAAEYINCAADVLGRDNIAQMHADMKLWSIIPRLHGIMKPCRRQFT